MNVFFTLGCFLRDRISNRTLSDKRKRLAIKLNCFLLFFALSSLQVYALGVAAQTINLSLKEASMKEALEQVEKQSGYLVWYEEDIISSGTTVNVVARNLGLEDALERIFSGQALSYSIVGNTIVVNASDTPKPARTIAEKTTRQQKRVSGEVRDSLGSTLPSVSVSVKNRSTIGTTTDLNGRYVLDVPSDAILVFSMIGFTTREIPVGNQTEINVVLQEASSTVDEVVVVGFGKQKKTDMIGSITSVKPADLKVPSSNLTTALAGRASGIIGFQRTGEPGMDNADFFIRGVTTFGYKVDPLILIDNVEVTTTDLARLQVDDIEDFVIMKDATATAVYGARGANGVILITTKEGKEGKARVSLRLENSLSMPTQNVELVDPVTYMKMANEAVLTRDPLGFLPYSQEKIENTIPGSGSLEYPATDWRDELLKDYTMNQRVNLSVSGGGKVARYYVSGALNQDNGILKVDKRSNFNNNIDLKTYSLRSNVNINLSKTTQFTVRLSGSFDDYIGPINGGTRVYRDIMRTNPTLFAPYYPAEGEYQHLQHIMFGNYGTGTYLNPYADMVRGYKEYSRSMVLAQMELEQNLSFITEGLSFRSLANTTRNSFFSVQRQYNPFYYQLLGENATGSGYNYLLLNEEGGTEYLGYNEGDKTVSSVFYMESALNYRRTFNDKHTLSGMLVYIMRNRLDGNAGSLQLSLPFRNLGLSGRTTYSYDDRYFAEFNFGYNGSERFHISNRFGFFPSAGLAWSVSNEKFWENIKPVVDNFRIRGTYGLVGNDAIGDAEDRFFYLSNVEMNSTERNHAFGENRENAKDGISITRYSNPDITWETAYKTNIAIELGLFNRLDINADFFWEHRKNILMTRADIPTTMGLSANIAANLGEAKGRGFDFSAELSHSYANGLWLQGLANFTYATSSYEVFEEPDYEEPWLTRIGYPINVQRGYIAERLFIDDEEVANSPQQFGEVRGGDIKYMDVNGDGRITTLDQVPLGYPTIPEINYGIGLSAGHKGFDISVFFQGLARESFWIGHSSTAPFRRYVYSGTWDRIIHNQVLQAYADSYWSEENRDVYALWPRLTYENGNDNNERRSTWFMRDGAFLRLKQAEIGYSINGRLKDRLKIDRLRIYINGSNLLTWSKFKLWDVEMAANGLDYPVQRVYNLGIQLSF